MRILIVDANHLASRARHAHSALRTDDGHRSGVVYGFLQSLSYVRNTLKVDLNQVWAVWDGGRAKYRLDLYPDYKRREPKPDDDPQEREDYLAQSEALRQGLTHIGVRSVRVSGCEADDLIALMAQSFHELGDEPIVFSGDNDLHQLIDVAQIFDPKKDLMTAAEVLAKHQVGSADQILLLKALKGDPSDRITGVKGIGDVKALQVLPYALSYFYGGQDPTLPPDAPNGLVKAVRNVIENADVVRRNLSLMRLPRLWDDPPHYDSNQCSLFLGQLEQMSKIDRVKFVEFLREWELESVIEKLERW